MGASPGVGAAARGREALRGQVVLGTRPTTPPWSFYLKVIVLAIFLVALWRSSVALALLGVLYGDGDWHGGGDGSHPAVAGADEPSSGREHRAQGEAGDL